MYCLALFLFLTNASQAQKFTISGYIKDASSGESLIGANVWEQSSESGSSANTYGFYSLTLPADSVMLIASYVGYSPHIVRFQLQQDTVINIELQNNALLEEIVISAEEADKIQEVTRMSSISVPLEQTLDDCEAFLSGQYDEVPEDRCYMRGTMDIAK